MIREPLDPGATPGVTRAGGIRLRCDGKQCTRIGKRENRNSGGRAPQAKDGPHPSSQFLAKNAQAPRRVDYYF